MRSFRRWNYVWEGHIALVISLCSLAVSVLRWVSLVFGWMDTNWENVIGLVMSILLMLVFGFISATTWNSKVERPYVREYWNNTHPVKEKMNA